MSMQFYYNGNIRTMDPLQPRAEALLVEDGKVVAAGSSRGLSRAARGARGIDLAGRTVLPGFIDGHSHLVANTYRLLFANASPSPAGDCNDAEGLVASLRRQFTAWQQTHDGQKKNAWFIAMGYDESVYPGCVPPNRLQLDQISGTIPICVIHASGHAAVLNTPALDACGISPGYTCPEGGRMPKLPNSNTFSGLLEEEAFFAQQQTIPRPGFFKVLGALKCSARQYASFGITTAQDARVTAKDLPLIRAAQLAGVLPLDVALYFAPDCADGSLPKHYPAENRYFRHVRPAGYKLFLDGSPQAKTAWLSEPYVQPPEGQTADYCGFAQMTDEELLRHLDTCFENYWQPNVHVNGDAAIEQFIRCWGIAKARHPDAIDLRPVAIHCQTVRPDQLDRMAALGMRISFFEDHVYYWGDHHTASVLGPERAAHISPLATARARGIGCTLHQDTPVAPPNMLFSVQNAVCRRTRDGLLLGGSECVTPQAALECITLEGARQLFEEDHKGSLAPGKLADLVLLSADPCAVQPWHIGDIRVLQTVKQGHVIYTAPAPGHQSSPPDPRKT